MVLQPKLRILVLKTLAGGAHSGYSLIKQIHEKTGWKPSYGSVYPLLEHLHTEGVVKRRDSGKRKLYALTALGKGAILALHEQHQRMVDKMRETQQVMMHLCDVERDPFFDQIIKSLEEGNLPFPEILKTGYRLRKELARIAQDGLMEQRKHEIRLILEATTKKLQRIKKTQSNTTAKNPQSNTTAKNRDSSRRKEL